MEADCHDGWPDAVGPGGPGWRQRLSIEVSVALEPTAAYRRLLADEGEAGWGLLQRIAIVLLIVAIVVPIMAVQRITLGLVATAALSWSFALVIQLAAGAAVILSAPGRRVSLRRALDLWWAGHLPYSAWLLLSALFLANSTSYASAFMVASAIAPAAWTAAIVSAYCRTVLMTTEGGAQWRTAAHQAAVWASGLTFVAWSTGGWFQIVRAVWNMSLTR